MRRLSHKEFMIATNADTNQIHNLNSRGHVALAFARNAIAQSLSYIELDALCYCAADALTETYTRKLSAAFVIGHFDILAMVLATAEVDLRAPKFFSIIDFHVRGKLMHAACGVTTDNAALITADLALAPLVAGAVVARVTSINITALRAAIVANAARAGIDISASWLPPLESEELAELLQPYMELRDNAVATVVAAAGTKSRAIFEGTIQ
jgi:hypothetical protein